MKYKNIIALWNAQADEFNKWGTLGEDEKIEFAIASCFPIFDILPRLWAAGFKTLIQDGRWWLFKPDGDGDISGNTFRDLCVNIVLAGIDV